MSQEEQSTINIEKEEDHISDLCCGISYNND